MVPIPNIQLGCFDNFQPLHLAYSPARILSTVFKTILKTVCGTFPSPTYLSHSQEFRFADKNCSKGSEK